MAGRSTLRNPQLRRRAPPRGGRRAGYITDGDLRDSVHFTAGIAICQAAGCTVTDLAGATIDSGRGLIAAADRATHEDLLRIVSNYL